MPPFLREKIIFAGAQRFFLPDGEGERSGGCRGPTIQFYAGNSPDSMADEVV
jgi:hypothetical protein